MLPFFRKYKVIQKPVNIAIVAALLWLAYEKLMTIDVSLSINTIKVDIWLPFLVLLLLILVGVNWFLEIKKWQLFKEIDFVSAFKTVMLGLVANMFVPSGVGDFAVRTVSDSAYRKNAFLSLYNSYVQFFPTLLAGTLGVYFVPDLFFSFKGIRSIFIIVAFAVLLSLPFLMYFKKVNFKVLILSLLRYLVFMVQVYILFYIFDITFEVGDLWKYVSVFFLIRTLIPTFLLLEIGVRAAISVLVFYEYKQQMGSIIAIFTLLLLINNYLPAIIFKLFGNRWTTALSLS